MLIFTIRRLIGSLLVLLVTSFLVFVYCANEYDPLKPFRQINPAPSKAFFAAKAHQYHLDQPVIQRYWDWLRHLIHVDGSFPFFGFNFGLDTSNNAVASQLAQRFAVTTRLVIGAVLLAVLLAIVLGVISGVRRDKPIDIGVTILTFLLIALPTFWFAALLKTQAISFNNSTGGHTFETAFEESPGAENYLSGWSLFQNQFQHLILPTVSLGLLTAASWIRYQRASTIDVLDADYMRLARAKGVRYRTVVRRHGLRNALIPLVTVMAIDIGALFGGAIITEKVYAWNGLGAFLADAYTREDTYAVIGWVMLAAIFVVLFNLLADLLYAVLDPRIRLS
ncbi:MAG: ABC transporter permease [Jatrophihabitans sp.]